jgi:serine protease Do
MVGINTAIARLSPDGLPITNISFSLKSNVAKQWLREQGLAFPEPPPSEKPGLDKAASRSIARPGEQTTQPDNPILAPTVTSPSSPLSASSRPYNLDRLISERSRAEADLEDMIKEMRGKFSGR